MNVLWRKSAVTALVNLDRWRRSIELPPISQYLRETINHYFLKQDFSIFIPGRQVFIEGQPVELRMVLISVGKSDPYKVFYRYVSGDIEIFLVRHPHENSLLKNDN
jgi:hypothetical protein